ncbi:hypothetical protein BS47DRAFT_1484980 [Hydnum rufescens UP504]|uniref:F-box domain-containing protein n=1 Tax=Hydnum rufescens UP504 TaxID=1448309 RepID=A0A9P6AZC6_9AGAM|nr:hypothetical protein BS47DRAFT_1484980 [Hydnum rufescens UP504]
MRIVALLAFVGEWMRLKDKAPAIPVLFLDKVMYSSLIETFDGTQSPDNSIGKSLPHLHKVTTPSTSMGRVGGKGAASTRRRKTSTKKSPNQKPTHRSFGQPATINDLPVETLLEICSYMKPMDAVHITRTNPFFVS